MMSRLYATIGFALALTVGALCLASPAIARQSQEIRLALVISQTNYSGNLSRVGLAEQEAEQVSASLSTARFTVKRARDLSQPQLRAALNDFRRDVERAGANAVAFVYYTGHGVSHPESQDSYLLGVDAQLQGVSDLPTYGVDLQTLRDGFGATGAKAVFLVFDACRDVPGLPGWKSGRKGLQRVDARADMLVAFSTGLNTPAREGSYAPILAEELRRSGQSAVAAFDAVQRRVAERSAREQLPWFDSQLYKQVCFISCTLGDPLPVIVPMPSPAATPPPVATPSRPTILTFETMRADTQALGFEIPPCTLSGSTLECAIFVTAKQKYEWYFNDKSHLLDENGASIPVASMTIGGETRTTTNWGYKVEWRDLMPGTRTRIVYRFSGVRQPENLQAFAVSLLFNEFATIRWDGQQG